ncbi:MAG: 4Fe-4S binding protein [Proteobacteria bacterium]|nr:4Fe-4S binding protein [Pseudomonadota bacterium]MBU4297902.1 4Fe-4S binding protein [Pseudomonadota bacterium]MCG2746022.1 4Fe-4S binding protein [Desulfobulbaceae bacterium]
MYSRIYVLRFPKETSDKPIICKLVQKYGVEFNILKATILPQHEGLMVLELLGHKQHVRDALDYLKGFGVKIESLSTIIRRDDDKCFQCGACTGICPTQALFISRPDMAVLFDPDKCTGCGLCVTACPVRAMEVSLLQTVNTLSD